MADIKTFDGKYYKEIDIDQVEVETQARLVEVQSLIALNQDQVLQAQKRVDEFMQEQSELESTLEEIKKQKTNE